MGTGACSRATDPSFAWAEPLIAQQRQSAATRIPIFTYQIQHREKLVPSCGHEMVLSDRRSHAVVLLSRVVEDPNRLEPRRLGQRIPLDAHPETTHHVHGSGVVALGGRDDAP